MAFGDATLDGQTVSGYLPLVHTYQSAQLDALGDATRRAIVERLLGGPQSVGALARRLPVSRPAVSQHLRVLKQARLVSDAAVGTQRIYALDPAGFESLRSYLDRFWDQALTAFQKEVERTQPRKRR